MKRPKCDTPGCGRPIPVGGEGHPEICPKCLAEQHAAALKRHASVYHRQVPTTTIDVYRVLWAFKVDDPCISHAIKKLLLPGERGGGKSEAQDIDEAIKSLRRWIEMRAEEKAAAAGDAP